MKFLEHQGYKARSSVLYQDNISAIRLEKNGQRSSSRRTRHIDIKYFWVKDMLKKENIEVVYCPTDSMVAEFFTKPLQGAIFKKLCNIVMGRAPISSLKIDPSFPMPEERVGKCGKAGHGFSGPVTEGKATRTRTSGERCEKWRSYLLGLEPHNLSSVLKYLFLLFSSVIVSFYWETYLATSIYYLILFETTANSFSIEIQILTHLKKIH